MGMLAARADPTIRKMLRREQIKNLGRKPRSRCR
jgi:hypothetical protein